MLVFDKSLRILKLIYKIFTSGSGNLHFRSVDGEGIKWGASGIVKEKRQQEVAAGNIILLV